MPDLNEAKTREQLIDPALARAGWDVNNSEQVGIEIPVDKSMTAVQWQEKLKKLRESGPTYNTNLPRGISDYLLYHPNALVFPNWICFLGNLSIVLIFVVMSNKIIKNVLFSIHYLT